MTGAGFQLASEGESVNVFGGLGRQRFELTRGHASIIEKTGGTGALSGECVGQLQHLRGRGHALTKGHTLRLLRGAVA